jgi:hypothetical protein
LVEDSLSGYLNNQTLSLSTIWKNASLSAPTSPTDLYKGGNDRAAVALSACVIGKSIAEEVIGVSEELRRNEILAPGLAWLPNLVLPTPRPGY